MENSPPKYLWIYGHISLLQRVCVAWLSVVFCPPLPYWSEAQFNSTNNDFLSVVTYSCSDGYAFEGYSTKPGNETVLTSMCLASKQWYPDVLPCHCTYRDLSVSQVFPQQINLPLI